MWGQVACLHNSVALHGIQEMSLGIMTANTESTGQNCWGLLGLWENLRRETKGAEECVCGVCVCGVWCVACLCVWCVCAWCVCVVYGIMCVWCVVCLCVYGVCVVWLVLCVCVCRECPNLRVACFLHRASSHCSLSEGDPGKDKNLHE